MKGAAVLQRQGQAGDGAGGLALGIEREGAGRAAGLTIAGQGQMREREIRVLPGGAGESGLRPRIRGEEQVHALRIGVPGRGGAGGQGVVIAVAQHGRSPCIPYRGEG